MRLNKLIASRLNISRRRADSLITDGKVLINNQLASPTSQIADEDIIKVNGSVLPSEQSAELIILFNKPVGYVCSRNGQKNNTIYDILPIKYHHLNPVGRLDKNSSGLLVLTNDGQLHQRLSHPKYEKEKIYQVKLNKPLSASDQQLIERGIELDDGLSKLKLTARQPGDKAWQVTMREGRNRQIRRTFAAAGYKVIKLHRINFGPYKLSNLKSGQISLVN